jgi:hypothetical protein
MSLGGKLLKMDQFENRSRLDAQGQRFGYKNIPWRRNYLVRFFRVAAASPSRAVEP